jgi:long-chain fatty acid transport protein
MIVTAGIGYSGEKRINWAADVRFIDYENTKGFDQGGFDPVTGAVKGLGWKNIWVFATGVQIRFSDQLSVRAGYGFNQNPIRPRDTFFNLGSSLITQHQSNVGLSYRVKEQLNVSFAYHHAFENSIQGQYQTPLGSVPGSSVQSSFGTDVLVLSFSRQF